MTPRCRPTNANPTSNELGILGIRNNGLFGPNFTLVVVPVPAAAWLALPLLGAMAIAKRRRLVKA